MAHARCAQRPSRLHPRAPLARQDNRLGRPTVVYYASQADRRALGRWVSEGGFEQLGDPGFAASCRRYRAYLRAYGWTFAALWLLFGAVLALRA